MDQSKELFVRMILLSWESQHARTSKLFESLSDEQFNAEVSAGRNRGIYLLGHLTAVNDSMTVTLGLGDRLFPQLESTFVKNPDKATPDTISVATLKDNWKQVGDRLKNCFKNMTAGEWFLKHATISDEDFAKEPHRNRLNVLISRISHEAYHHGQLALLQKK